MQKNDLGIRLPLSSTHSLVSQGWLQIQGTRLIPGPGSQQGLCPSC